MTRWALGGGLHEACSQRGGLQEVGSTRVEAGEGEGLQGRHMFEVLEDQVDHGSNWWGWIECG